MKVRNGFVSNSSSSSFIISDKHFSSVKDLAIYMINKKIEEYTYENENVNDEYIEYDKKLILKLDNIDENSSVCFPSCNYDTYIKKFGDCYLVSTCNNTQWDLYNFTTQLTENARNAINETINNSSKKIGEELKCIIEEPYEFYHIGKDYYDLRHDFLGVETYEYCPNEKIIDHGYNYHLWETVKYGKICLVCNKTWKRKEKLEKINNKSE